MKVKSKTDTTTGANEKIKLIDGFGFNGSYNYLADSFKLSPIYFYLRSTLFKQINISASTTLNPYRHDSLGININKYAWEGEGFSLGQIIGGNIAISTSFKSKPMDPKKEEEDKKNLEENQMPMTQEEQQAQLDYIRQNPGEFVDFNISWSVNISYSLSFSNTFIVNKFVTQLSSAMILNGDFNLTEKWKMGFNCYYDVKNLKMQSLTTFLSRDMHCWQLPSMLHPSDPTVPSI